MGPISKSKAEHVALVFKLKRDINKEVEQISRLVDSIDNNEYELYYLYFKLTQLHNALVHDRADRDKIPVTPVNIDIEGINLHASNPGA